MLTVLIRSIFIYLLLIAIMRILGKRQIGELEASELVTTLLISEIATLPITDTDVPVSFALIPMIVIMTLEVAMSFILIKLPKLRWLVSSHPSIVISKGIIDQKELERQRISIEEFIAEIRSAGYSDLSEIYYAIIEENGSLTVIPKSSSRQPTASELGLELGESGLMHIIITDGQVNKNGLKTINKDEKWLNRYLSSKKLKAKNIFLMLSDDSNKITLIEKDNLIKGRKK